MEFLNFAHCSTAKASHLKHMERYRNPNENL